MSRAKKQRSRGGRGLLPLPAKSSPSRPAGLSQYTGRERRDPIEQLPKAAIDAGSARVIRTNS